MNSIFIAQTLGLLLWLLPLAFVWRTIGQHRNLPAALIMPGYLAILPIAFVLRGLLGEVSLALPALTACACRLCDLSEKSLKLLGAVIVLALALYISALGFVSFDIYARGYYPNWEIVVIALLMIYAYAHLPVLAWAWLCGLGLFVADLHPSPNLWDALIDLPSVVLSAYLVLSRSKNQLGGGGAG